MIKKILLHASQSITKSNLLAGLVLAVVGLVLLSGTGANAVSAPSAAAKKFFGFSHSQATSGWAQPSACNTAASTQNKTITQKITQVSASLQTATDKLNTLKQQSQSQSISQSQQTQLNQEVQQQQSTVNSLQQQLNTLHTQQSQVNPSGQNGPSDACKKAIVEETVAKMSSAQSLLSKFPAVLAKVSSAVKKVEAALPSLQKAGVSSSDIKALQSDVKNATADSTTLNAFYKNTTNGLSRWIQNAKADPTTAFYNLQKSSGRPAFMNQSSDSKAGSAANNVVSAFTDMVNRLDAINKKLGGNQ